MPIFYQIRFDAHKMLLHIFSVGWMGMGGVQRKLQIQCITIPIYRCLADYGDVTLAAVDVT